MAWPKKGTRSIVVKNVSYKWHLSNHSLHDNKDVITVGIPGKPYVLFIDPYPWNFEIKPSSIKAAIQWAQKKGWSAEKGPTKAMTYDEILETFTWLPEKQ